MSDENENATEGGEPTIEQLQAQLAEQQAVIDANHPNSKVYKEAAEKINFLNIKIDELTPDSDEAEPEVVEPPVEGDEMAIEGVPQCSLQECLAMQRKHQKLALEEAAEAE